MSSNSTAAVGLSLAASFTVMLAVREYVTGNAGSAALSVLIACVLVFLAVRGWASRPRRHHNTADRPR